MYKSLSNQPDKETNFFLLDILNVEFKRVV